MTRGGLLGLLYIESQYSPLHQGYFQTGETKFKEQEIPIELKSYTF